MSYEKPQLALIASAVQAVKGDPTKESADVYDNSTYSTPGAYQADE